MLITVITPTLPERAELLADLTADLDAQTFQDWIWLLRTDESRRGPAVLRNELAVEATTDWLAFIDDDDRVDPDHLQILADHSDHGDIIYTQCRVEGRSWQPDHDCTHESLATFNTVPVTTLVRRSVFLAVGGFPLGVHEEDWHLWRNLQAEGAVFHCIHQTTWTYRFHDVGQGNRTWNG
jgi:glycosyltransferase involved in cell wall biosynthesis